MGFLDDARKRLGDAVDKHGDKIHDGLDRAGAAIDKRTGGKHSNHIRTGVDKAKTALDNFEAKRDDSPTATTPTSPVTPNERDRDRSHPTGPAGTTVPTQRTAPTGPMGAGESSARPQDDPDRARTDASPEAPPPGANPNEDIASGTRPAPSGGAGA